MKKSKVIRAVIQGMDDVYSKKGGLTGSADKIRFNILTRINRLYDKKHGVKTQKTPLDKIKEYYHSKPIRHEQARDNIQSRRELRPHSKRGGGVDGRR